MLLHRLLALFQVLSENKNHIVTLYLGSDAVEAIYKNLFLQPQQAIYKNLFLRPRLYVFCTETFMILDCAGQKTSGVLAKTCLRTGLIL